SLRKLLRELSAGDQRQGRQIDAANHPRLADGIDQEQPTTGRSGSSTQPDDVGLGELLRSVLPIEVSPGLAAFQRGPVSMGATEVSKAVSESRACVDALVGAHRAAGAEVVRPVATRSET